ncbi:MAG TPA: MotA/TolQ/ExbB proton channel family protein [Kofleriaceae bacterium]|nr:MotA/TolQ/ExbB proton channel family protein [Kofleriaceae bacterium]
MTDTSTIDAQILDLMLRAGSRWVLWLLIGLSLAAIAVIGERLWFYIQERKPGEQLARALGVLREKGPAEAARVLRGARSIECAVVLACLERAGDGPGAVDEQRAATVEVERQRYEKRLAFLGTLGNNAPFIGLFGTVMGIIRSFHDLAGSTLQGTEAVMSGIAEALVATGVGLLVALPAVATYNAFMRHVETAAASAEAHAHEVLAYLKAQRGGDA